MGEKWRKRRIYSSIVESLTEIWHIPQLRVGFEDEVEQSNQIGHTTKNEEVLQVLRRRERKKVDCYLEY